MGDEENSWGVSTCFELGEWKDWVRAETAPLAARENLESLQKQLRY
jgi:hypothetical protein